MIKKKELFPLPLYNNKATISAYAKINLHLSVFAKESSDRLHRLGSLFHTISLHDTLELQPSSVFKFSLHPVLEESQFKKDSIFMKDNLLIHAWKLLKKQYGLKGEIQIVLTKRIPIGAGLGGGSSDVAALINWTDQAYGLTLTQAEKVQLALQLGSDVPFFLKGGMAWIEGVGEKITPLNVSLVDLFNKTGMDYLTIVENELAMATQKAYAQFVTYTCPDDYQSFKAAVEAIETSIYAKRDRAERIFKILSQTAKNAFMEKILADYSELKSIYENLQKYSSYALLTGSGSAFFAYTKEPLPKEFAEFPYIRKLHRVHFTATGHEMAINDT